MSENFYEDDLSQFYARRSSVPNYGTPGKAKAVQNDLDSDSAPEPKEGEGTRLVVEEAVDVATEDALESVGQMNITRGFLFSVSRQGNGEYWPLRVGTTSIGRMSGCDVSLPDENVANRHAELMIEEGDRGLQASLCVFQEEYATQLNGLTLKTGTVKCHDRDLITVGDNLQFLLMIVDVKKYGLEVADKMVAPDLAVAERVLAIEESPETGGNEPSHGGFDSEATRLV